MVILLAVAVFLVLCMVGLGVYVSAAGTRRRVPVKALFGANLGIFFGMLVVSTIVLLSGPPSLAQEAGTGDLGDGVAAASQAVAQSTAAGFAYIGAALSTGLATIGTGIAVAFTGSAALGAISDDQSLLGMPVIFVGMAEVIAIYGLIVSIIILSGVQ
jgi:V/A-type H+-transporting ATPase subunit K